MKNSNALKGGHLPQFNKNKTRAENKDNLDSREGEEQTFKGDDVTHNRKEKKNKNSKVKTQK